jgi:hypothetical protein
MEELQKKREELGKTYKSMFEVHCAKYSKHISKEDEYRESARNIRLVYKEWYSVSLDLEEPIPLWF